LYPNVSRKEVNKDEMEFEMGLSEYKGVEEGERKQSDQNRRKKIWL
jgi:hypothetical protein